MSRSSSSTGGAILQTCWEFLGNAVSSLLSFSKSLLLLFPLERSISFLRPYHIVTRMTSNFPGSKFRSSKDRFCFEKSSPEQLSTTKVTKSSISMGAPQYKKLPVVSKVTLDDWKHQQVRPTTGLENDTIDEHHSAYHELSRTIDELATSKATPQPANAAPIVSDMESSIRFPCNTPRNNGTLSAGDSVEREGKMRCIFGRPKRDITRMRSKSMEIACTRCLS